MSFSIQLTPDLLPVEPGATTPISVAVVNRSDEADQFEMEVEGIDAEWKAVPVPIFSVEPHDTHTEKVFFKPHRTSESLAGNYPFVVRVRSLISGETKIAQGVLQIKPFNHLTMEMNPKKGFVSPGRRNNIFDVAVVNLGNTEHTLQFLGSDPEDACTYEFEHEQVTIAPGQQRDIELTVSPRSEPIFSAGRLIGFTVTGRSIDPPSAVTSSQAQLEQRSLLSPATVVVVFLLAILAGAWFVMRPKPPVMTLNLDKTQVMLGDPVTVTWDAQQAGHVLIRQGEEVIYDGSELQGSKTFTADESGTITIYGLAEKDGRKDERTRQLDVATPPEIPSPTVKASVSTNRIRLGESFILKYTLNKAVTRAVVSPLGTELDLSLNELQITPTMAGRQEFTIVVTNSEGETSKTSVQVNVVDESDARISYLRATPEVVEEPETRVTLDWLVTNAVTVQLTINGSQVLRVEANGPQEFNITEKAEFVLTAYDSKGRTSVKKITVDYKKIPPPDTLQEGTDSGTTSGATTGSEGTTTGTVGGTP